MKLISTVSFTAEEAKALKVISDISCEGIMCDNCPFCNFKHKCVKQMVKAIYKLYCGGRIGHDNDEGKD